jgi:hypothetical protein
MHALEESFVWYPIVKCHRYALRSSSVRVVVRKVCNRSFTADELARHFFSDVSTLPSHSVVDLPSALDLAIRYLFKFPVLFMVDEVRRGCY